ncbi:MAG: hypothetical protein EOM50_00230 [Erysipelotrichia bacterium]|nr:hypothetical protein [Erysipelotrichia bacterium]NCC55005.1 hypothetical protein [Erysipelotrichia bacterium]
MKLLKPTNKIEWCLCISGLFLLPLFSLYLASQASLFYENLTYVGNLAMNRSLFIIWGILQSLYYFICFYYFTIKTTLLHKNFLYISGFCTLLSIIAFLLPYQNHSADIVSQLHVYGSMLSCIITYIIILYIIKKTADYDYVFFQHSKNIVFLILTMFAFCIILLGDISTLSELILLDGLNLIFLYFILYP